MLGEFNCIGLVQKRKFELLTSISSSYFTTGKVLTMEELSTVQGRAWEDVDH